MKLDFLDYGLPVEPSDFEAASRELYAYRQYCKAIGKKSGDLTQEDMETFYKTRDLYYK